MVLDVLQYTRYVIITHDIATRAFFDCRTVVGQELYLTVSAVPLFFMNLFSAD